MSALLEVSGITAFYGASQALFGVDLIVNEGEAVALMGRNGMGKTTTIKTICRMMSHRDGEVRFADTDLAKLPSHKAARLGIGLVPEGRRCFARLSVMENLMAAARAGEWDFDRVSDLFPRLAERRDQKAMTLSGGEQQMLAIGRALMTNPRLLILDEATEGLAPVVRQEIWAAINRLKQSGLSILVVDKSLKELSGVADRYVVVEKGVTAWTGAVGDLTDDLADRYLGYEMTAFTYAQKVLFQHCDPAGIVFYPRYFEMINATVEEWFEARIGFSFAQMHGVDEVAVPTAGLQIAFKAPSRLGEMLEFRLVPKRLGRSSLDLEITAVCGDEQRLSMTATLVFTRRGAGKSVPWPDDLRAKIDNEINEMVEKDA